MKYVQCSRGGILSVVVFLLLATLVIPASSPGQLVWPASGPLSSVYNSDRGASNHNAIDIAGPNGQTVLASYAGTASYAGWNSGGYGNLVILDHASSYQTYYAHNQSVAIGWGQSVSKGQHIANEGTTGDSTGPHVHFEVRRFGSKIFIPGNVGNHVTKNTPINHNYPGLFSPSPVTNLGGWYRLKARHSGKFLDIAPDHVSNGANLQQYQWVGGSNQIFQFEHLGDGWYKIWAKSAGGSRVLDVAGCGTANGSNVHQWDWFNNDCQKWRVENVGGGYVRLVAKASGRVLEVGGSSQNNQANVIIWDWWGGNNQQFQLEWVSMPATGLSGTYTVASAKNGRVLDIAPDFVSNGANLQIYDYLGGNNQKFTFEHLGSGTYKISAVSAGTNRVLDVHGCGTANGTNIQQWTWFNNACQKFLVENVRPGQVRIVNQNSGNVIDHAADGNGANVHSWDWWGGANQRWILESVTTGPPPPPPPPPVEVIVDNTDAGFSNSSTWVTSSFTQGYYGTNYEFRSTEAIGDSSAWTVDLPESGSYEVFARWTSGTNRSSTAPYIVYHSGGTTTVHVNQQANGGQFVSLGTFTFDEGSDVRVRLSCWTTSGFVVIADAVRFLK